MNGDPLSEIAALLDALGVPYAVIGAHAVNAWLEPRFTADVDITVQADAARLSAMQLSLAAHGLSVSREHGAGQPSGPDFIRFASAAGDLTLEIQTAKTDFQRVIVARAIVEDGVRIATPEDLIVMKLIADRAKDQIDLLGLAALPEIDWAYIEQWADAWGIVARLHRLRRQSAP